MHVILDVSFHENKPYYSKEVLSSSLQGENLTKELGLERRDGGVPRGEAEFLKLEATEEGHTHHQPTIDQPLTYQPEELSFSKNNVALEGEDDSLEKPLLSRSIEEPPQNVQNDIAP